MKAILIVIINLILTTSILFSQDKSKIGYDEETGDVGSNNLNILNISGNNNMSDANLGGVGLTTVLKTNNSTSSLGRAPQGSKRYINSRYLINSSEMKILGYSPLAISSVGWTWNNALGAGSPTSQGVSTTGDLRIYIKDTSGSATSLSGTYIDTTGAGFTKIYDGTIVIPSGFDEIDIDLPLGGPGTSPYSTTPGNGVIIIFVYRTTDAVLAALNTPAISCTNVSGGNIITYHSTTVPGAIGTSSSFRPETRFGFIGAACDMRVVANLFPYTRVEECAAATGPKARFQNVGTSTQTNVSVSYRKNPLAPGPAYSSTKIISSIDPGEYADITFDPLIVTGGFDYQIFVYAACDVNSANDTIEGGYTLSGNSSYGGPIMTYYFANNTYCGSSAPNTPIYNWEDTTGSVSLEIDGVNSLPGIFSGTLDDGYWSLGNILAPGDYFRFNGVDYDSFFVSTNGQIGLTQANNTTKLDDFAPLAIPSTSVIQPGLFPLWKDFDLTASAVPVNRVSYKIDGTRLIITYDRMPNFGAVVSTDYVSFQVILEIMPGPTENGNIIYQYSDVQSGDVFIQKYMAYALANHTVGIQNAAGTSAISYRRWTSPTLFSAGPLFSSPVAVAFGSDNNALPVELSSFVSGVNGNNVTLDWSTSHEINNSGFEIERSEVNSQTSNVWSKIGYVKGNGNTSENHFYQFTDRGLNQGKYNYRLKQIDFNGNFEYHNLSNEVIIGLPGKFNLSQNFPNPFNPSTKISYDLPFDGNVSLRVFDMTGKEVMTLVNEFKTAGYYTVTFNGAGLSTGVYVYRISADANGQNFSSEKRMVLVK